MNNKVKQIEMQLKIKKKKLIEREIKKLVDEIKANKMKLNDVKLEIEKNYLGNLQNLKK